MKGIKKMFSFLLVFMLLFGVVGTTAQAATKPSASTVNKAYKKYLKKRQQDLLKKYKNQGTPAGFDYYSEYYRIMDVNNDGIKDLVISYSDPAESWSLLYTYKDGKVKQIKVYDGTKITKETVTVNGQSQSFCKITKYESKKEADNKISGYISCGGKTGNMVTSDSKYGTYYFYKYKNGAYYRTAISSGYSGYYEFELEDSAVYSKYNVKKMSRLKNVTLYPLIYIYPLYDNGYEEAKLYEFKSSEKYTVVTK